MSRHISVAKPMRRFMLHMICAIVGLETAHGVSAMAQTGEIVQPLPATESSAPVADDQAGFRRIKNLGKAMTDEIRKLAKHSNRHGMIVQGVNSMFQIFFTDKPEIADYRDFCTHVDRLKFRDFALRLMDKGVYMNPSATLHSLSSIAHTEADIATTAAAMAEVLEEMP